MADKIDFLTIDPDQDVADLKAKFEELTGRILQPAQAEQLVFQSIGYRISLLKQQINETANKCFVVFANGPALDLLGQNMGVTRLPASPATCVLRFTLVAGHSALNIPEGIRVQSIDGQATFITIESKSVDDVTNTVDIKAECTKEGIIGNGYAAGNVSVILDPLAYVSAAVNTDTTSGGSDAETDDELRERIFLAPSQFSVAGPTGAYKFFAKSAHPSIVDVAVTIGHDPDTDDVIPGQVDIFPLMADGSDPSVEIQDAILAICNDEKIRPLTDTVVVKAPTKTDYAIEAQLVLLTDAVQDDVVAAVTANLQAYVDERKNKLGIDVVKSQLIGRCSIPGAVYDVVIASPSADIVAGENEWTNCTGITVTVTGTHDE